MPWLNPSWQLSPTPPLARSPRGMGQRTGRVKVRKPLGCDKNSLIVKATHASEAKQTKEFTDHFPWTAISRKAGFHHTKHFRKDKDNTTSPNFIPFFLLPSALYAEYDVVGSEMSLWSVGVSCPSLWHHRYVVMDDGEKREVISPER